MCLSRVFAWQSRSPSGKNYSAKSSPRVSAPDVPRAWWRALTTFLTTRPPMASTNLGTSTLMVGATTAPTAKLVAPFAPELAHVLETGKAKSTRTNSLVNAPTMRSTALVMFYSPSQLIRQSSTTAKTVALFQHCSSTPLRTTSLMQPW